MHSLIYHVHAGSHLPLTNSLDNCSCFMLKTIFNIIIYNIYLYIENHNVILYSEDCNFFGQLRRNTKLLPLY